MNEVEKLYENAGVEMEFAYLECHRGRSSICCPIEEYEKDDECMGCINSSAMKKVYEYPSFTAEKQLHLIKWLSDKADYVDIHYDRYKGLFIIQTGTGGLYVCNEFEQALASRVNIIWQDLTDAERKQIKEILE